MKTIGQIGFDAYGEAAGWVTFDGRPMPTWEQLGATPAGLETRRRWEVSALAVCDASPFRKPDSDAQSEEGARPLPRESLS